MVEGAPLLREYTGNGIEGSNPFVSATPLYYVIISVYYTNIGLCTIDFATIGCYSSPMQSRVSVPKIFLRGNPWYVRVQAPKAWQNEFCKKEYWISLKTSDRQEALGRATETTEKKRWELITVHRKMNNLRQVLSEPTNQQRSALAVEAYPPSRTFSNSTLRISTSMLLGVWGGYIIGNSCSVILRHNFI